MLLRREPLEAITSGPLRPGRENDWQRLGREAIASPAAGVVLARLAPVRMRRRETAALIAFCFSLGRALRSGLATESALGDSLDGVDPCSLPRVRRVVAELGSGRPLAPAVDDWIYDSADTSERLVGQAIRFTSSAGGNLANCVDGVGLAIRERVALESRRRVLAAQAKASASVLVALPILFALVASGLRGGLIYKGRAGLVLLVAGLSLDAAGLVWMRRMQRSLL